MRSMVLFLALLFIIPSVILAAAPPQNGNYFSTELPGASFLSGYFSESWVDPGTHGQIGNTINAASWNGSALGTDWKLWCPSIIAPPVLVSDTRDGMGTGDVVWQTDYDGGYYWMSKNGPWSADNLIDFTGTVLEFNIITTYQYVFGDLLGIRSNITMIGKFDMLDPSWDTEKCIVYEINNASFYGSTDIEPKPADFPEFMDDNCQTGVLTRGGWGDVTHIAIRIDLCTVPVESATWGSIKAMYEE
jgi:hypothetical protein